MHSHVIHSPILHVSNVMLVFCDIAAMRQCYAEQLPAAAPPATAFDKFAILLMEQNRQKLARNHTFTTDELGRSPYESSQFHAVFVSLPQIFAIKKCKCTERSRLTIVNHEE